MSRPKRRDGDIATLFDTDAKAEPGNGLGANSPAKDKPHRPAFSGMGVRTTKVGKPVCLEDRYHQANSFQSHSPRSEAAETKHGPVAIVTVLKQSVANKWEVSNVG